MIQQDPAGGRPTQSAAVAGRPPTVGISRRRWAVLAMLFAAMAVNYLDRQALSVLAPVLREEFSMSNTDYSNVLNSFLFAFTVFYVIGGRLVDLLGSHRGLVLSVAVWGAAESLHALAGSVRGLALFRFLLGAGEATQPPASSKCVAEWFPPKERGLATSVFLLGAPIGAMITPPLIVWLYRSFGWQYTFLAAGLVGLLWVFPWSRVAGPRAPECPPSGAGPTPVKFTFRRLLALRATWGVLALRFFVDPVWYFYVFWMPEFLVRDKAFSLEMVGLLGWIPFLAAAIGTFGGGSLASWLQQRGWPLDRSHKRVMWLSALLMTVSCFVPFLRTPWQVLAAMSVAIIGMQMFGANNHTLPTHLFPAAAVGTIAGLAGASSGVGSMVFTRFIGVSVDATRSYAPAFLIAGLFYPSMALLSLKLVGKIRRVI